MMMMNVTISRQQVVLKRESVFMLSRSEPKESEIGSFS